MNHKPGFIPIVIAIVVAAVLVGGTTYGITSSKRNKIIKDQEAKINQLSQDLEDLKIQLSSSELSLPEETSETPSIPSGPSTPSSPSKPTTPAAKPATPAAPTTPAQPANMKTWSGKLYSPKTEKWYPLSFQYPQDYLKITTDKSNFSGNRGNPDRGSYLGGYLNFDMAFNIDMDYKDYALTATNIKTNIENASIRNNLKHAFIDESKVKMITVGGKPAVQFENQTPSSATIYKSTWINIDNGVLIDFTALIFDSTSAELSEAEEVANRVKAESVYQQILSSMKF